ncbi:hypothetical protein AB0J63_31920 [Streptosporangium canum]|uniref:hypothetical protein n=1 Tax=Streptosporangium canum TaxID=324952 RepID=UPI00343249BC
MPARRGRPNADAVPRITREVVRAGGRGDENLAHARQTGVADAELAGPVAHAALPPSNFFNHLARPDLDVS